MDARPSAPRRACFCPQETHAQVPTEPLLFHSLARVLLQDPNSLGRNSFSHIRDAGDKKWRSGAIECWLASDASAVVEHTKRCVQKCVCARLCVYVCACKCAHAWVCTCSLTCVCACVFVSMFMCARLRVYWRVCMCVCVRVWSGTWCWRKSPVSYECAWRCQQCAREHCGLEVHLTSWCAHVQARTHKQSDTHIHKQVHTQKKASSCARWFRGAGGLSLAPLPAGLTGSPVGGCTREFGVCCHDSRQPGHARWAGHACHGAPRCCAWHSARTPWRHLTISTGAAHTSAAQHL